WRWPASVKKSVCSSAFTTDVDYPAVPSCCLSKAATINRSEKSVRQAQALQKCLNNKMMKLQ
ncbi:MAG: hypothetical protein ACI4I8_03035, partial [Oscillospiraceae bacterium]